MKRRGFLTSAGATSLLAACDWKALSAQRGITGGFVGANHERGHLLRSGAAIATPKEQIKTTVAIIGAGVAGLAVARQLRKAGIDDYVIFDLEDEAGGNSRGHVMEGINCPLGAHYLPLPGRQAHDVRELLQELKLLELRSGIDRYDERHLCHSPQERLLIRQTWQDGLLPTHEQSQTTLDEYARFADRVRNIATRAPFAVPTALAASSDLHTMLDAEYFGPWLKREGFESESLLWYLDYCCRDDYGAGLSEVSAWAGIHYFASRHGFDAPRASSARETRDTEGGVLTWPQGNGWLTQQLAAPHAQQLRTGALVQRIETQKSFVLIDVYSHYSKSLNTYKAEHAVVCTPLFIAQRLLQDSLGRVPAVKHAASALRYAPWLVANVYVPEPLGEWPGTPRSWDNVMMSSGQYSLGYVDAMHQSMRPTPASQGPTVLTLYMAFGTDAAQRRRLYEQPWKHWVDVTLNELSRAHTHIRQHARRVDVMRYGHAMVVPTPGLQHNAALHALRKPQGRLHFAHSDLAGYSVFEEAFHFGSVAGRRVAQLVKGAA
jgi:monoamine oxidase